MEKQKAIVNKNQQDFEVIVMLVRDALTSENSKRAYGKALNDFLDWYREQGQPRLSKAIVQRYKAELVEKGLSPATINLRMSAIRKLANEAADNGYLAQSLANGITKVNGVKMEGVRAGNWLTKEQAQDLICAPDITTLKGLRDRAVLAVLIGAGLRRSEVAGLTFDHIQQRDCRWVIIDITGKHNRVRTIPIPSWAKVAIDEWADEAGINAGLVFRRINKGDRISGASMTPQAVRDLVIEYTSRLGYRIAAHDLRRTYAKLAYKGGSKLDQIQLSLGHASIRTTERYLGVSQDLTDAPCDRLGLHLD
jgi:site-specific recombinase XerD